MFNLSANYKKLITICKFTANKYATLARSQSQILPQNQTIFSIHKPRLYCSNTSDGENVLSLDDNQINEITQGNEEQIQKLRVLLLEAEIMRQEGKAVPSPSSIKMAHWKELLSRDSRSGRRKYLAYLFKLEKKKDNRQAKKVQKRIEFEERPPIEVDGPLRYDLGHNNMFLRFYDSTMNNFYNNKLIQAMQFSQKIVIDCGYYENMNKMENVNCSKQLTLAFAENRAHDDPFDLHYCNLTKQSILEDHFHRMVPTMYDQTFPMNVHESSYTDLFPKEKIVYLTPHCREEMEDFEHDTVYIIGAIVDKVNNEPLSLAKAKREGLKMAKLPLDKYLMWGAGSGKSLTINQVLSIMLDRRFYNDWEYALRHVPRRKLVSDEEIRRQREVRAQGTQRPFKQKWRQNENGQVGQVLQRSVSQELQTENKKKSWRPTFDNESKHVKDRLLNVKNILNE